MTIHPASAVRTVAGVVFLLLAGRVVADEPSEFFEKRIRPVLAEHCYECHSATSKKLKGGLRVDSRAALLQGGDTGPALVPGKPEASLLLTAVSHRDENLVMPPRKPKLPDAIIADLEHWIREGAQWPSNETTAPSADPERFDLTERKQRLPWIWEAPRRQTVPAVRDTAWPLATVDRFVLARLEMEGLRPAPPAEPELWLRRVHFALTGLPPAPEAITAFLKDPAPNAREWVVDRLLASPHFGERWARHWLDLVRYAESRGHESDYIIPNAYEYRDYVIRALNADVPYDAFVREHLAGDLLPRPRRHLEQDYNESILGTGWAFLGEEIHAPVDTRLDENERVDNRIDVMTKTFLGLTVSCARCHDHKFDAITQRDYYALAGFFISSGQRLARFETMETEREAAQQLETIRERRSGGVLTKLAEAQATVWPKLSDYLTAAATAVRAETNATPKSGERIRPAQFSRVLTETVNRLAAKYLLAANLLGEWTAAVLSAANTPADALHPLTRLALGGESTIPSNNPVAVDANLPEGARVVVDFGKLPESEWFADGFAFGLGPMRAGELRLIATSATNSATLRMATRAAAQSNTDWRKLELSPGVESEPTLFGKWKRDGATLRSPKFELSHGKLHYLVRGSGRAFATVDSQRLVTGPLHTALIREWAFKDDWHWISQDLSEYAGHRVAIEFSPGDEFDTAIALVVESERVPVEPLTPGALLARELSDRNVKTLADAVTAYREIFITAGSRDAPITARSLAIQDWLLQRPELFSGSEDWPAIAHAAVREWRDEAHSVLVRIPWKSRTAPAMLEGNAVDEYLLVRGKHQTTKGTVPRRFLEAIHGTEPVRSDTGSGRLELAETLTAPDNPLLARVLVNRAWHHLFGRGIVATTDNFGWLGQRPTHPELLDDLAVTFMEEDRWSLKRLIRRLVLSRTFAMSSKPANAEAEQRDPENLLLHRMNLKRLEGESIRDAMLAVSGRLDRRMYGPSVPLHPSQFVEARGLRNERGPLDGEGRRSIYVSARRNFLPMMMTAFDTPTPFTTVGRRNVSNVPGQMLFLMNDPFVHQQAQVWAERLLKEMPDAAPDARIRQLYLAAFGREPNTAETARCLATLDAVRGSSATESPARDAWVELCHALFGVKEFLYVR